MRKCRIYFLIVLTLISSSLINSLNNKNSNKINDIGKNVYNVYSSIITNVYLKYPNKKFNLVVIVNQTNYLNYSDKLFGNTKWDKAFKDNMGWKMDNATFFDYKNKKHLSRRILPKLTLQRDFILVSVYMIRHIFKKGVLGWEKFYRIFPDSGGYICFSEIGFNRNKDQAMLYFEMHRYGTIGQGGYLLLEKNNYGIWEIVSKEIYCSS